MKKLTLFCIAACATVLSVGQPARADWKLVVRNESKSYYYDENYTYPIKTNHNATIIARLMEQGHAPIYGMFSCFTTGYSLSSHEKSDYGPITEIIPGSVFAVFRDQYCKGASVQPKWKYVDANVQTHVEYFYDANYVRPIENGKAFITRAAVDGSHNPSNKIEYLMLSCNSNKFLRSSNGDFSQSKLQVFGRFSFIDSVRNDVCFGGDPDTQGVMRVLGGGATERERGNGFINSTFGHTVVH